MDPEFDEQGQDQKRQGSNDRFSPLNPSHNNRSSGGGIFNRLKGKAKEKIKDKGKQAITNFAKKQGKNLLKKGGKKLTAKAAVHGATAATAAPSAGTSLLISAGIEALDQLQQFLRHPIQTLKKWETWAKWTVVIALIIVLFFILIFSTIISVISSAGGASMVAKQSQEKGEGNQKIEGQGQTLPPPPPNNNDCNGLYTTQLQQLQGVNKNNFGDPGCDLSKTDPNGQRIIDKDKIFAHLGLTYPPNVAQAIFVCIMPHESAYNPNALNTSTKPGKTKVPPGAFGLFQMNQTGYSFQGRSEDVGDVYWKAQITNAVSYNTKYLSSKWIGYWPTQYQDCLKKYGI